MDFVLIYIGRMPIRFKILTNNRTNTLWDIVHYILKLQVNIPTNSSTGILILNSEAEAGALLAFGLLKV
ncbi:MAG: hypothetical protein SGI97_08890 [candidate division Zixibacteria bacterium]|nr:hypothetical protein [candidate division Zixibacteria bacterium]